MASALTCTRCGAANEPGTSMCVNCGSPLSAGPGVPGAAPPMYPSAAPPPYGTPPGYAGYPSPWEGERRKQIDRTKTGLLLLLVGTLIAWIPVIGLLGALLLLIGAILVILGRKAFGPTHTRNVVVAIVLFFVGLIGVFVLGAAFAFALFAAASSPDPRTAADAVANALNNLFLGLIVVSAISGLASVLFTYALQRQIGKALLWAGYAANLAVQIAVFAIISPLVAQAVSDAVAGGTFNSAPFLALQAQVTTISLLSGISSLLFAAATYLAWSRVSRGEIPAPTAPPATVAGAWPPTPPSGPAPPISPR